MFPINVKKASFRTTGVIYHADQRKFSFCTRTNLQPNSASLQTKIDESASGCVK